MSTDRAIGDMAARFIGDAKVAAEKQQAPVHQGVSMLQAASNRMLRMVDVLSEHLEPLLRPLRPDEPVVDADIKSGEKQRVLGVCDLHESLLSINDKLELVEEGVQSLIDRLAI